MPDINAAAFLFPGQYMGCVEVLQSMRALDFSTRTQVTRWDKMLFTICRLSTEFHRWIVTLCFCFKAAVYAQHSSHMDSSARRLLSIFACLLHSFASMTLPVPKIKVLWNPGGFLLVSAV